MKRLCAALFAASCLGLAAADDKKPTTLPGGKVDWGLYVDHVKIAGEIDKVSESGMTLATTRYIPRGKGKVDTKVEKTDYQYHDNALVRWVKAPPKLDIKGKKTSYTEKEMKELKAPPGSPGYAAAKSDLAKGSKVELQLMRPKGVSADKLVSTDYKIKYVVIQDTPTPPAGPKPGDKDEKKKP